MFSWLKKLFSSPVENGDNGARVRYGPNSIYLEITDRAKWNKYVSGLLKGVILPTDEKPKDAEG